MTNYVFAYSGGTGMAATPQEQEQSMADWGAWFGAIGASLVEGGNPFGAARTVHADGSATDGGVSALTGYTVVSAPDLAAAADLAKGCPVLTTGGTVEVYEAIEM
ncbi:MAG: hypothetical protein ACRD0H_21750 [Actinomycetes bacterium]